MLTENKLGTLLFDPTNFAAIENCTHPRLIPGLDIAYCPDCRQEFRPRSPEYQKAIADKPRSRPRRKSSPDSAGDSSEHSGFGSEHSGFGLGMLLANDPSQKAQSHPQECDRSPVLSMTPDSLREHPAPEKTVLSMTPDSLREHPDQGEHVLSMTPDSLREHPDAGETPSPPREHNVWHWTRTYHVHRGSRKHLYYCYVWQDIDGSRHHKHIPGGSIDNQSAIANRLAVEQAIADGWTVAKILELLKSWRTSRAQAPRAGASDCKTEPQRVRSAARERDKSDCKAERPTYDELFQELTLAYRGFERVTRERDALRQEVTRLQNELSELRAA